MMNLKITKSAMAVAAALMIAAGSPVSTVLARESSVNAQTKISAIEPNTNFIHGIDRNQATLKNENGQTAYKKTGENTINGKTVYFDQFGAPASGVLETKDGSYRFDESGQRMTGFVKEENGTAWYDEQTGLRADSEQKIEKDGKTYILDENGLVQGAGWVTFEGQEYCLDRNGAVIQNRMETVDGTMYSFDAQGQKEVSVKKNNYIFDENGKGKEDLSGYDKIAAAAKAQVGAAQDCTMLVTNSLKAVGIDFHGAPESYLSLGPMTDNPVPGDIVVYSGHVAIYIGNGQAVHGGWNGWTTEIFSVNCASPLIGYVHPTLPKA